MEGGVVTGGSGSTVTGGRGCTLLLVVGVGAVGGLHNVFVASGEQEEAGRYTCEDFCSHVLHGSASLVAALAEEFFDGFHKDVFLKLLVLASRAVE